MKRATALFPGGVTLVELMLASALVSIVMIFIFSIVRNVGDGVVFIQTVVPLRQDLQFAKQTMERDLFSSVRSSLGNVLPNPGFEAVPTRISTFTPTPMDSWSCIPVPVEHIPGGRLRYSFGSVSNRPEFRFRGNLGLGLNSLNTYRAFSSTFPLVDGGQYLVGGWIRQTIEPLFGGSGDGFIRLLGDSASWPATERVIPSFWDDTNPNWTFIWSTFSAVGTFSYRVELGVNFEPRGLVSHFGFDDVVVTPLTVELTPTSGQVFEFGRFETAGALAGQRIKIRYRMVPCKNSGRLIRERVPNGAPVGVLGEINNIRRCKMAWDFGGPTPGIIGPTTDLSRGFNFPLIVTLEAGPVGATGNQTESLSFSVFPEVP